MVLAACSSARVEDYKGQTPPLDLKSYLQGKLVAKGVIFNWKGKANEHFVAHMTGTLEGDVLTLVEEFVYQSGRTDQRTWVITFKDEHNFTATAGDVLGHAVGKQYGNAGQMAYKLRYPVDGKEYDLSMVDWFYRVDETTVISTTTIRKFGLKVGELVLTFEKA